MTTLRICIDRHELVFKVGSAEVRRFIVHYQNVVKGEVQAQHRFVFREGGDATVRTLIVDCTKVQWVLLEEEPAEAAAEEERKIKGRLLAKAKDKVAR